MMLNCWVTIIPVRWFRLAGAAACVWICTGAVSAQSLDALADRYRKTPSTNSRAAVLRYSEIHRADKNGALALLLLGATETDQRQFGDALTHLKAAGKRLPELADYTAYLSAVAESGLRQFSDTASALTPVWQSTPASPLVTKAVLLQAESRIPALQGSLRRRSSAHPLFRYTSRGAICSRSETRDWRRLHARWEGAHRAAAAPERRKFRPGSGPDWRCSILRPRERIGLQISDLLSGQLP